LTIWKIYEIIFKSEVACTWTVSTLPKWLKPLRVTKLGDSAGFFNIDGGVKICWILKLDL
jgi:hypothetical protein